jgi:hypothetical protein
MSVVSTFPRIGRMDYASLFRLTKTSQQKEQRGIENINFSEHDANVKIIQFDATTFATLSDG